MNKITTNQFKLAENSKEVKRAVVSLIQLLWSFLFISFNYERLDQTAS